MSRGTRGGWYDRRSTPPRPAGWAAVTRRAADRAGWRCQACDTVASRPPRDLLVEPVDGDFGNTGDENLAALCRRCWLRLQLLRPPPPTNAAAIAMLRRGAEAVVTFLHARIHRARLRELIAGVPVLPVPPP